jgi:hypothetical protein
MTTSDGKTKLAQLILFNSILIYGSQSIIATPTPQLAKSKMVVVELTIDEFLADGRIEVPISTTNKVRGVGGSGASFCSHCNKPSTRYLYDLSADRRKNGGVIVHLILQAAFADGKRIAIEKDIFVPRKNFVQQDFGDKVKMRAYFEGTVKSAAN